MRFRRAGSALVAAGLFVPGLQAQNGPLQAAPRDAASQVSPTEGVGDEFTADFMAQHVPELLERAKTTSDGTAAW